MGAQTESEQSYTERTATAVRDLSDWFDTKYARPGLGLVQQAWATRPGLTTFLVLFGALSIVPILMFLLFAVVVSATFIVVGLGTAVVAAVAVIAFTGSFLICLLLFLVFVAAGLTAIAISSLFAFQLFGSVDLNGLREGGTQMLDDTQKQGRV
ncbi:hypothetical protein BC835DRAFT_545944 [Cytidiella melzeri]|nr:hypothetical protein BC835DRAFT_545944 [Cytidiella melzeri]